MASIHRILVPTDFSEPARHALEHALALADTLGASVEVLHVGMTPRSYAPLDQALFGADGAGLDLESLTRQATERALDAFEQGLPEAERERLTCLLEWGVPDREIVRVAGERGHDLIVLGSHGRTGAEHVLVGSVAERVVRRAACPVLVVR